MWQAPAGDEGDVSVNIDRGCVEVEDWETSCLAMRHLELTLDMTGGWLLFSSTRLWVTGKFSDLSGDGKNLRGVFTLPA